METEKSKIGELYREAFKDFSVEPSQEVWTKISNHPGLNSAPKPGILNPVRLIVFAAAVMIGTSMFMLMKPDHSGKTPQVLTPQARTETVQAGNAQGTSTIKREEQPQPVAQPDNHQDKTTPENPAEQVARHQNTPSATVLKPIPTNPTPGTEPKMQKTAVSSPMNGKQESNQPVKSGKSENSNIPPVQLQPENQVKSTIDFSEDQMMCKGDSVKLTASGGEAYSWSNGATTSNITVSPSLTTVYTVTVTDFTGALIIHDISVKVGDCNAISIPNAFTPNSDGTNDVFRASGTDLTGFSMIIFSRTGQMVFESHEISKGWDGYLKGKMAEPGVYVYQVKYTDTLGKSHTVNGHLTLLR